MIKQIEKLFESEASWRRKKLDFEEMASDEFVGDLAKNAAIFCGDMANLEYDKIKRELAARNSQLHE